MRSILPLVVSDVFSAHTVQRMNFDVFQAPGSDEIVGKVIVESDTQRRVDTFRNLLELAMTGKLGHAGDRYAIWHTDVIAKASLLTKERTKQ
jgi:hypothetical protein